MAFTAGILTQPKAAKQDYVETFWTEDQDYFHQQMYSFIKHIKC